MASLAIDDAKRFLYLHPHSTTAVDNPVELLAAVVEQFDKDLEETVGDLEDEHKEDVKKAAAEQAEELAAPIAQKLLAFIKGLRDDLKICEAEYQVALSLAKVS